MLHPALSISPSALFWPEAARQLLRRCEDLRLIEAGTRDFSALRVMVPAFSHAQYLQQALSSVLAEPDSSDSRVGSSHAGPAAPVAFIAPLIGTLGGWLALQPPRADGIAAAHESERLMRLYAELRQHGWLKKMFGARRNADLLPLAQTLLSLSDELTEALLPAMQRAQEGVDDDGAGAEARWDAALAQLPPSARALLSDEAQLVWSIWRGQLDASDAFALRFEQMRRLAAEATAPLIWFAPAETTPAEAEFLRLYAERCPVLPVTLDWRHAPPLYAAAWPELAQAEAEAGDAAPPASWEAIDRDAIAAPPGLSICRADSLEDVATQGAQTIVDWLQAGRRRIAIVAQDRMVARRIRALLERAEITIADETGWKLSTTRAASVLAACFDAVTARGDTKALLDLLKSPYVFADAPDKADHLMTIELAWRRANVLGGWNAVIDTLQRWPESRDLVQRMVRQVQQLHGRKTLPEWSAATLEMLAALGVQQALGDDAAGQLLLQVLQDIEHGSAALSAPFTFPEWRAFIGLQMDAATFMPKAQDRRVVMLPLNGSRLRRFDAVLVIGADAEHLPSQAQETLFFSNAVRHELGLATRATRQRQQLRDLAELLFSHGQVVLCWQTHQDGEPNPLSPWIERLQLTLALAGRDPLPWHRATVPLRTLQPIAATMPAPSAGALLPAKLSASGYNSFVACPYQFFAGRMLGLNAIDEFSDMPEKRDYGDWLHQILNTYHQALRDADAPIAMDRRAAMLGEISAQVFGKALNIHPAALGYYTRWQKAMGPYLEWANAHEAAGWRFVFGEQACEKPLAWSDGEITLHGRIDRIDEHEDGARLVLDYKTGNRDSLRRKLREGEDHQLAFYGLLSELPVDNAQYVTLEADKTGAVEAPKDVPDYATLQRTLQLQLKTQMKSVAHGAPLPANGVESVCQYCDVRGLCRKGAWL
ncbi:MAG TPA: PD-(D/E)XK nuclease family protein [Herbaspirillum sp.]